MIWSISWRNVWRNKIRSLAIILAVTIGLFGGIFTYAFMIGMSVQRTNAAIEYEVSNIQIHNPKFFLNEEINYTIDNPNKLITVIEKTPGVKAACKRIKCPGMASTSVTGTGIVINGINPEKEKLVSKLYTKLIAGKYFEKGDKIPVVVGQKLAKKLKAKVGSKIVITVANVKGVITYGAYIVIGIYKTGNDIFDEANIFVESKGFSKLIGFDKSKTSEIAIILNNNDDTKKVTDALQVNFINEINKGKITIQTWEQMQPALNAMTSMMDIMSYIFLIIILIALAFGIVNTMLMIVMERVRELGMLMAIGMNHKKIFSMIMLETIFLSIIGGVFGIVISIFIVNYFNIHGLNLAVVGEGFNSMGYSSIVYLQADNLFYIEAAILVIITAIISSIYPALKALKLKPADAVREDA
ncbi:MAG: FtsX-like permease family protein [Bacteroidales bacterium]|nr:FtsX-like permease family protein [Bacteroidales bacterium]